MLLLSVRGGEDDPAPLEDQNAVGWSIARQQINLTLKYAGICYTGEGVPHSGSAALYLNEAQRLEDVFDHCFGEKQLQHKRVKKAVDV